MCAARVAAILLLGGAALSAQAQVTNTPSGTEGLPPPAPAGTAKAPWYDPGSWPIIPVPEIDVDPESGTTLGIIPTWLDTNSQGDITRIIAPDIIHNPYFGWGARARVFGYPSADEQWSVVGGAKQKVESEFDARFETGRLRDDRWSYALRAVYDRSGTPRFYGIGNNTRAFAQTVYTEQQMWFSALLGFNFNKKWQLAFMVSPSKVKVLPGHLQNIPSIERRFGGLLGIGTTHELLNRLSLTYDTRDDLTIPTRGMAFVTYAGLASRRGAFNDSLYSEAGFDVRGYWSPSKTLTWAGHLSLNYLPSAHRAPFFSLNSLGGDQSTVGGPQPLRGYGVGRFYGRDSFVANLEMRQQILSLDALSTHLDFQLTPFVDVGRVFNDNDDFPIRKLHTVGGVGIRGIARPSVVGYVDVGKGSEGIAVFTGINYPF
jgi:hypothetical protein